MKAFDRDEAVARMKKRNTSKISWTLKNVRIEWEYIPATNVRNYDGTYAGSGNNPEQKVLQCLIQREGRMPTYTNFW